MTSPTLSPFQNLSYVHPTIRGYGWQGRSGKTLGLFYNIEDDFVDNALAYVAEVRAMYPETVPCFMYGQSLGGLLCTLVAERSPAGMWAGMIPIAPAIKGNDDLGPWQRGWGHGVHGGVHGVGCVHAVWVSVKLSKRVFPVRHIVAQC